MCYDYHGKWDTKTGHNAPLGPRPDEAGADLTLNVDYTLQYLLQVGSTCSCHVSRVLLQLGARRDKTVLGVPLYGRAFTLTDPAQNNMGAPAKETSFQVTVQTVVTIIPCRQDTLNYLYVYYDSY